MKRLQSLHHVGRRRLSARVAGTWPVHNRLAHNRRGVLLLVVLSLLVLFALIGITFLLMAGQNLRTMKAELRTEQTGDDPRKLLDEVFAQCIRDTNNPHSAIRGHSLLNDMYGNDGVKLFSVPIPPSTTAVNFTVAATPGTPGQLIDIAIDITPNHFGGMVMTMPQQILSASPTAMPLNTTHIQAAGFFNGCVLTPLNGVASHQSTRVVGSGVLSSNTLTLRILAFDGIPIADQINMNCNALLINGRPFNGTGFGFAPGTAPTDPTMLGLTEKVGSFNIPLALLPNMIFSNKSSISNGIDSTVSVANPGEYTQKAILGGADEDYDAPDGQNLLLAHLDGNYVAGQAGIIPSLHRPESVEFLRSSMGITDPATLRLLGRQAIMRPQTYWYDPTNNPPPATNEFPPLTTSTNANDIQTALLNGPFDVDNDGDGIRESIWVDVGLPVQTAPDGRTYKPLAAILCLDMEGRLNVNAHGNTSHVDQFFIKSGATAPSSAEQQFFGPSPYIPYTAIAGITATGQVPALPRGQGYGPPEISLYPLFSTTPQGIVLPQYAQLLATRYAEPNATLTNNFAYNSANNPPTSAMPGITNFPDTLAALKFTGIASEISLYSAPAGTLSEYGSPTNVKGVGYVALDVRGMPLMPLMGMGQTRDGSNNLMPAADPLGDAVDSAYELNLSRQAAKSSGTRINPPGSATGANTPRPHDAPFTPAELERVLRMYDLDAQDLPDRLYTILANGGPNMNSLRNLVTTEGFDLPSPSVLPTRDMRRAHYTASASGTLEPAMVSKSLADLLKLRMIAAGYTTDNPTLNIAILPMLPAEVASGLRMDLNRPFGNGRDDDSNGIVDEPSESEPAFWTNSSPNMMPVDVKHTNTSIAANLTNGIDMDYPSNGISNTETPYTDRQRARQLYARHLYILMMLLKDQDAQIDFDNDGTSSPASSKDIAETARGLAQWAVNVVDFRDRDSIMTMFEYDINPFKTGWTSDGVYDGDNSRGIVWGCERPELLISETLAFHDVRTEDLNSDPTGKTTQEPIVLDRDNDYDQRLLPRGSFFVELYNPWVTQGSVITGSTPRADEESGEFYNIDKNANTATGVRLNATSLSGGSPVWRMLIVKATAIDAAQNPKDPDDPIGTNRPTITDIERSIYFVQPPATGISGHGQPYFPSASLTAPGPAPILPGRYGVIGSAGIAAGNVYSTPIGRLKNSQAIGSPDSTNDDAATLGTTRRIVLTPSSNYATAQQVMISNNGKTPVEPTAANIQPPIAIVIDRALDAGGPANRSISISEPVGGYTAPTNGAADPKLNATLDTPLDSPASVPLNLAAPVTSNVFRYVHLQRLADPTQPYNLQTNPYLTIDTAPVPLTVFNGVAQSPDPKAPAPVQPNGIASAQRGAQQIQASTGLLWPREKNPPAPFAPTSSPPAGGDTTHNFKFVLEHSLGYINKFYGIPGQSTVFGTADAPTPAYVGAPKTPLFPWLVWNNRPFTGPVELMLVPKSRSSRLLFDYSAQRVDSPPPLPPPATPALNLNIYQPTQPATGGVSRPYAGHLLDFFPSPPTPTIGAGNNQLHRILEYVQVPSRFVGTDTELDPQTFNLLPYNANEVLLKSHFHPPFNKVSNYRNPGRININTIPSDDANTLASSQVWFGLLNQIPGATNIATTWKQIALSRGGGASVGPGAVNSPTRFANPFRTAAGASLGFPNTPNIGNRDEVDVTLLRSIDPNSNGTNQMLFDYNAVGLSDSAMIPATPPYTPTTHPYFRLQNLQKYHNLLTTRSNVYAIWVTVGFFEVEAQPVPPPAFGVIAEFPDGYKLKGEMGSDTGETKRHRAFYMYDRSIPVGFEPGRDHNIESGVLIRRFIE